jgi:hypothetical protein
MAIMPELTNLETGLGLPMDDLRRAFEKTLGISFSTLPIPELPLVRIFDERTMLYGTQAAKLRPVLYSEQVHDFAVGKFPGYFLVGAWGYGVNSYAFYYVRDDGRSRIYFRLAHGGVYMDNEAQAAHIASFLPAFFAFESAQRCAGASVLAIDAMGWGLYRVSRDGQVREHFGSLFASPGFDFDALLKPGSSCLRVGNLWNGATTLDVAEVLSPCGTIRYHRADHESEFSLAIRSACLVMGNPSEARAAVANLHDREFHGHRLEVTQSSGVDAWS